jgi:signal transduction histidine kinase
MRARRRVEWLVVNRIVFLGHLAIWGSVFLLLAFVTTLFVATVVALAWGVLIVAHGFFFVAAPVMRKKWVAREVDLRVHQSVTEERRAIEGRHARALEALTASMAHEIRSPITAAKSLAQQIAEDPTATANAEYAGVVVTELARVERSVSHLLRYTREEPLVLRETTLADVVESALETLRSRIESSTVRVEPTIEGSLRVLADPDKLRRVVINLVTNALEALANSGFPAPRIDLTSGESSSGHELWLRVRDNGPGIEAERLDKIFDPFHTSKVAGTGLGLAITRKLVEAHGGTIEVHSTLGAGTSFVVTLPRFGPSETPT